MDFYTEDILINLGKNFKSNIKIKPINLESIKYRGYIKCDKCNQFNHKINPCYCDSPGEKRTHCKYCGDLLVDKKINYYVDNNYKINEIFNCEWKIIYNYKVLFVDVEKMYYFNERPIPMIESQILYITDDKFSKWADIIK